MGKEIGLECVPVDYVFLYGSGLWFSFARKFMEVKSMGKNPLAWVLEAFVLIMFILAFLPWWHELLLIATKEADDVSRFLLLFLFDPTEYVWKWVAALLAGLIVLFRK